MVPCLQLAFGVYLHLKHTHVLYIVYDIDIDVYIDINLI